MSGGHTKQRQVESTTKIMGRVIRMTEKSF
jgi:hypothetical protein